MLEAENGRKILQSLSEGSQAHRLLQWEGSWQAGEDMSSGLSSGVHIPGVLAGDFQPVPLARKLGQIWVKGARRGAMSASGGIHNMELPYFIF